MVAAPYCNVEIAKPTGKPHSPTGIRPIPPNTPNNVAWTIINNNFNQLIKGNFSEVHRQTVITRIFDPSDHNVWVDVKQITGVLWGNPLTGQTITWNRGAAATPPQPTGGTF